MPSDCVFCDVVQSPNSSSDLIVYQDDLVLAAHVLDHEGATYLGQLLLQTKRHVPGYAELTDGEAVAAGLALTRVARALKACTAAEKIYAFTFAEVVPHLHTYVTSRYRGTPVEYWRMNVQQWPDAPRGDRQAVGALCERLRTALGSVPAARANDSP
ncbi:MAG TPA: HIT family protein [Chloroflexota bacterium]|nr:HIT family protein [Chloroflexota bacterium]